MRVPCGQGSREAGSRGEEEEEVGVDDVTVHSNNKSLECLSFTSSARSVVIEKRQLRASPTAHLTRK